MSNNQTSFLLEKIEDLAHAVERLEHCNHALHMRGLGDSEQDYGISFKDNVIIFKDGTTEKIDSISVALLKNSRSAYQKCARMAKAVESLCQQGGVQPMSKRSDLLRLYDKKSFLHSIAIDDHKLNKFKKALSRAKTKEEDGEALVALVKILKKIGY